MFSVATFRAVVPPAGPGWFVEMAGETLSAVFTARARDADALELAEEVGLEARPRSSIEAQDAHPVT